jgi:hypothetical protein
MDRFVWIMSIVLKEQASVNLIFSGKQLKRLLQIATALSVIFSITGSQPVPSEHLCG